MPRSSRTCFHKTIIPLLVLAIFLAMGSSNCSAIAGMIISDAPISGSLRGASTLSLNNTGTVNQTLSYSNRGVVTSGDYEASVETDGIKLKLETHNATFSQLQAGVVDTYTIVGGTHGEQLNVNAVFVLEGTSKTLFSPNPIGDYFGHSNIDVTVGQDINSTGTVFGSSPFINAPHGVVAETYQIVVGAADFRSVFDYKEVDFTGANSIETIVPLSVIVGQAFQLAFSVNIDHTGDVETDMLNTAFVEFDLGSGYTITSEKGFGTSHTEVPTTSQVPEPTSLGLFGLGSLGIGLMTKRRRKSHDSTDKLV